MKHAEQGGCAFVHGNTEELTMATPIWPELTFVNATVDKWSNTKSNKIDKLFCSCILYLGILP